MAPRMILSQSPYFRHFPYLQATVVKARKDVQHKYANAHSPTHMETTMTIVLKTVKRNILRPTKKKNLNTEK